jgi:ATP-dependent Zn protease
MTTEIEPRTLEQLRRTAFHESGHAVVGRVVGMVCGGATIVPDYKAMTAGIAITYDHGVAGEAWEIAGKFRGNDEVSATRGRILGYMAGHEAEILVAGDRRDDGVGDEDDRKWIARMAAEAGIERFERLRPKARALVRCHWAKIEAVAAALLEHETLEAEQIDAAIDAVMTERERATAARIALARKPLRDQIAALSGRRMPRIPDLAESGLRPK